MKKDGEIYIITLFMCIFMCMLILFLVLVSYFQINTVLTGIKDSIFTISQNAIIAYNKEFLVYDVYEMDIEKLKTIINELLYKNHIVEKNKIENIEIKEIYLISNKQEVISHTEGRVVDTVLHIKIQITFKPIISYKNNKTYIIHEDIKLSLMKY